MSLSLLLVLPALALGAGAHVDVAASVRSEMRARSAADAGGAGSLGPAFGAQAEALLLPSLAVRVADGAWSGQVAYAPSLVLRDVLVDRQPEAFHSGTALLTFQPDARQRFFLQPQVGYGRYRLTLVDAAQAPSGPSPAPGGAPPPSGTPLPQESVDVLNLELRMGLEQTLSRRLSLRLVGGYLRSGGRSDQAREALPSQRGPLAEAWLGWRASRRDLLASEASVRDLRLAGARGGGERVTLGTWTARWEHALAQDTSAELGGGVGYGRAVQPGGVLMGETVSGVFSAALRRHGLLLGQRLDADASMRLTPVVDPFTASLQQQGEVAAGIGWRANEQLGASLRGSASGTLFTGAESRRRLLLANLDVTYALSPLVSLHASASHAWDLIPPSTASTPRRQWQAGVGLTLARTGAL